MLKRMESGTRHYLFNFCKLCGAKASGMIPLCISCKADLPWITSACQTCGLPLPANACGYQCGECLVGNKVFTLAITPLFYQSPVDHIINIFKHRRGLAEGDLLARLLAEEIRDHYLHTDMPEAIIPVPLHWLRFLWRGYNQSVELGKQLDKALQIPCRNDLVKRSHQTSRQQGLSREQRLHNLKGAFQVAKKIPFRRIALLDDVVTTGATATEAARVLLKHGVEEVHLWAIARTPL